MCMYFRDGAVPMEWNLWFYRSVPHWSKARPESSSAPQKWVTHYPCIPTFWVNLSDPTGKISIPVWPDRENIHSCLTPTGKISIPVWSNIHCCLIWQGEYPLLSEPSGKISIPIKSCLTQQQQWHSNQILSILTNREHVHLNQIFSGINYYSYDNKLSDLSWKSATYYTGELVNFISVICITLGVQGSCSLSVRSRILNVLW